MYPLVHGVAILFRACDVGLGGAGSVLRIFQIVFKIQDQEVAGAEAESGGFAAVGGEIAVARRAVGVGVIVDGEINL